MTRGFDDLLTKNRGYVAGFSLNGFDGIARAGVAMITCMDSRIEPLEMIGLQVGDAKILRTPGGRLTPDALIGCILGVHLLGVNRIMVVPHSRCAMASGDDTAIIERVQQTTGADLTGMTIGASPDQLARLEEDVTALRRHPLIGDRAQVGGFTYNVDTGELNQRL